MLSLVKLLSIYFLFAAAVEGKKSADKENKAVKNPTRKPSGKPIAPTGKPIAPTGKPIAPTGKPIAPTGKPIAPTGKPIAPTGKPIAPTGKPIAPTGKPIAPTEKPIEYSDKPVTKPVAKPISVPVSNPVAKPTCLTLPICQYSGYCKKDSDCYPGNYCRLDQMPYYSQCLAKTTTYKNSNCLANYYGNNSPCKSTTDCCDPGAYCNKNEFRQCQQPVAGSDMCSNPSGFTETCPPTLQPVANPTLTPSDQPTDQPTDLPTNAPSI